MIQKTLRSLFPTSYILLAGFGVLIWVWRGMDVLSYLMANLIFILVFSRVAVIFHEIGHLVFAKMAGGNPKRIILGQGHEIWRANIANVKVIFKNSFRGGTALANFNHKNYYKLRQFWYISGGFLTNFLLAYLTYLLFGFEGTVLTGREGLSISSAFIVANAMIGVFSLFPYRINHHGIKIYSDGLSLFKLPFSKIKKLKDQANTEELFQAFEYLEEKEFAKGAEIYQKYTEVEGVAFIASLNLSMAYLKMGDVEKAYKLLEACLPKVSEKEYENYKALVHNNLAWCQLLLKNYEEAVALSKVAYTSHPEEPSFQGTRGASLIEFGKIDHGIRLLEPLVDFNFPNNATVSIASYLAYAFHIKRMKSEKKKYLDFVLNHSNKMDPDELILWEHIQERMDNPDE